MKEQITQNSKPKNGRRRRGRHRLIRISKKSEVINVKKFMGDEVKEKKKHAFGGHFVGKDRVHHGQMHTLARGLSGKLVLCRVFSLPKRKI